MLKRLLLTAGSIFLMTTAAHAADPQNTVLMQVSTGGTVTMELRPDLAPKSAERIKQLTREGFYNGIKFHRVIDGFMAQAGDPTGTGTSGSSKPDLPAEFTATPYGRGTVGMARTSDPNSANSQFFICYEDCSFLNNQYTVVGQVTSGMEFIDKLAKGEPPAAPDTIVKMEVAADAKGGVPPVAKTGSATPPVPSPKDNGMTNNGTTEATKSPAAQEASKEAVKAATTPATEGSVDPAAR